ncbi:MAG: hypothetical protein AB8F26_09830 [Phycisphaerales bacterium]
MPDAEWQPMNQPPKNPFLRKLGTYLFGVGIGFGLLGWFQYKKSIAAQQQREQLLAEQEAVPNPAVAPSETPATLPDEPSP